MKHTPIISLRDISIQDTDFMLQVENDPEVWSYSSLSDAPYSRAEIEAFCSNSSQETSQLRKVILRNDLPVGFIDLYDITPTRASISIIIYPKDMRRLGVGRRALAMLELLAASSYNLKELCAEVSVSNTTSVVFFEKNGFIYSADEGKFCKLLELPLIKKLILPIDEIDPLG